MSPRRILHLTVALASVLSLAAEATKKTWDFESDEPGKIAKGFTNEVGQWEVAKDGDNHVLLPESQKRRCSLQRRSCGGHQF